MKINKRQFGMTLTEILVVVAIMAILLGISMPVAQHLMDSFSDSTGVRNLINAALSNARAIAVREGTYAGVRFQEDASGRTYMTFIIYDPTPNRANGYRAVVGRKPMALPENTGVMDTAYFTRVYSGTGELIESQLSENALTDALLSDDPTNMVQNKNRYYLDASTFSIIFNASGKLTTSLVWIRNKDSIADVPSTNGTNSNDTIFNKKDVVDGKYLPLTSMFYQDDYGGSSVAFYTQNFGIGPESSRQSFLIFDKKQYRLTPATSRWDYLSKIEAEYISPYTGELVMEYREQNP